MTSHVLKGLTALTLGTRHALAIQNPTANTLVFPALPAAKDGHMTTEVQLEVQGGRFRQSKIKTTDVPKSWPREEF